MRTLALFVLTTGLFCGSAHANGFLATIAPRHYANHIAQKAIDKGMSPAVAHQRAARAVSAMAAHGGLNKAGTITLMQTGGMRNAIQADYAARR